MIWVRLTALICLASIAAPVFRAPAAYGGEGVDAPRRVALYVAPDGSDTNPGTEEAPLKTLQGAIVAVRASKRKHGLPDGGLVVRFREGKYFWPVKKGTYASFTPADSGEPGKPIVYAGQPGEEVRFIGGRALARSLFTVVEASDPVWERLDSAARGKIVKCDLATEGVTFYGDLGGNSWSRRGSFVPWLYGGGKRLPLARYPDSDTRYELGTEKTSAARRRNEFEYAGERPSRWLEAPDAWIKGFLGKGYIHSHERITAIDPKAKRITLADEPENHQQDLWRWAAFNLIEEITQPGEWYLDRRDGTLYVWPPEGDAGRELLFTTHGWDGSQFIAIDKVSHVAFENLTFELSMRAGIAGQGCNDIRIDGCTMRCMDKGLMVTGTNIVVTNSEFGHLERHAIRLQGGDDESLTASGNVIHNNSFHDVALWNRTAWAIWASGCGTRVTHNEFSDCMGPAAVVCGPQLIFAYNDIARCLREGEEQGVIQTAGWTYGMRIEHNVLRGLDSNYGPPFKHGCGAIVFERTSGFTLEGNIICIDDERVTTGGRGFSGVVHWGGRDYRILNNVITGATMALAAGFTPEAGDTARALVEKRRTALDVLGAFNPGSPWYVAFPQIRQTDFSAPEQVLRPTSCVASGNVGWHNTSFLGDHAPHAARDTFSTFAEVRDNLDLDRDPQHRDIGFYDQAAGCLALRDESPAFSVPGFRRIPWELIGRLHETKPARPVPPVEATVRGSPRSLFWAPAVRAASYQVYVSIDRAAVERRDPLASRGRSVESHIGPGQLEPGSVYYWAVDPLDAKGESLSHGDTWMFSTAPAS